MLPPEPSAEQYSLVENARPVNFASPKHHSSSASKQFHRQDGRYERQGKRWVRRRENSRFAANPHVVMPTADEFGVYCSLPRATFPRPLPPYLPRRVSAPSALTPTRDLASSNAGRYSLSLKGVRRHLRRSGPTCEQMVLDIEQELIKWLHSGGIIISPDHAPPVAISYKPLGSDSILEVSRSPAELVWRVDEDFPRFLLHCVARYHGVISYSKTDSRDNARLTHLLRPNVTRPDFMAVRALDTPPASDIDTFSVLVDTDDSDVASERESFLGPEADDMGGRLSLSDVHEEHDRRDTLPHGREIDAVIESEPLLGENGRLLSVDSSTLDEASRDWEDTPAQSSRVIPPPPPRPICCIHRRPQCSGDCRQPGFWKYVFA